MQPCTGDGSPPRFGSGSGQVTHTNLQLLWQASLTCSGSRLPRRSAPVAPLPCTRASQRQRPTAPPHLAVKETMLFSTATYRAPPGASPSPNTQSVTVRILPWRASSRRRRRRRRRQNPRWSHSPVSGGKGIQRPSRALGQPSRVFAGAKHMRCVAHAVPERPSTCSQLLLACCCCCCCLRWCIHRCGPSRQAGVQPAQPAPAQPTCCGRVVHKDAHPLPRLKPSGAVYLQAGRWATR